MTCTILVFAEKFHILVGRAGGWSCFADKAVSGSDMSLFRNGKNRTKSDGLMPNDPRYYCIGSIAEYRVLTDSNQPTNFTLNTLDSSVSLSGIKTTFAWNQFIFYKIMSTTLMIHI